MVVLHITTKALSRHFGLHVFEGRVRVDSFNICGHLYSSFQTRVRRVDFIDSYCSQLELQIYQIKMQSILDQVHNVAM